MVSAPIERHVRESTVETPDPRAEATGNALPGPTERPPPKASRKAQTHYKPARAQRPGRITTRLYSFGYVVRTSPLSFSDRLSYGLQVVRFVLCTRGPSTKYLLHGHTVCLRPTVRPSDGREESQLTVRHVVPSFIEG
ncbi:hypothetical protein C8Q79DRAFT_573790 [Trametes meyenii]|nr:hypothetical protein C8Q79DRAFT_573790 [Trametes meyenii]